MMNTVKQAWYSYLKFQGVEWVYILSDLKFTKRYILGLPMPCATFKIGFTGNHGQRQEDIRKSIKTAYGTHVYRVVALPTLSAKHLEQKMHAFFAKYETGKYNNSTGGTEWFSRPNLWVFAFALVIGLLHTSLPGVTVLFYSLLILVVPLPLDGMLCLYLQWIITELHRSFFYAIMVLFSLFNIALLIKAFLLII